MFFSNMESEIITWLIFSIISSVPLIYWYLTKNFNYWSEVGINGPRPKPGVGNLLDSFIRPRAHIEIDYYKTYGKIYGMYNGTKPTLTVAEPELIKTILVKDFHIFSDRQAQRRVHPILSKHLVGVTGEDWKRLRSIVSPTFSSGKMKKMFPLIKDCLREFIEALEECADKRAVVDMKDMYGNYTMDVIATCAFATKTNAHKDHNNPFIQSALKVFNPKVWRAIPFAILPRFLLKALRLHSPIDESANQFFFDLTRHIIQERKDTNKKHNDFIQLLINAQNNNSKDVVLKDTNDENESHHVNEGEDELNVEKKVLGTVKDQYITEDEMLAQAWIFFNAGYETTATTLTFSSYELALNPDVQQKLYEEVMTAVDSEGDIDYDQLAKLPYLDAVISETLRMHSPVVRLTRVPSRDYKLGPNGITITKGQNVDIPIYAIHHSEEYYENPFRFNPERFLPENRHLIKPYTYLPFGAGPRNCIGMRFALMEAKVGLAQVVRRFRISRSTQTDVPLMPKLHPFLNSPARVLVSIEKRS